MAKILFHGSFSVITRPEIREPERTLDFGRGFYLTTSKDQAERWVKSKLANEKEEVGYVNTYTWDEYTCNTILRIKVFESANEEWVDFVLCNRMQKDFIHDYDIVVGPVADDKVYTQFSLFEGGVIDKDTLIRELKTYRLVDQYLFHTEKALPYLKYESHYIVTK